MEAFKNYLKTRGVGFYCTVAAAVVSLVQLIIYLAAFSAIEYSGYMHWTVIFFAVAAVVSAAGLSAFKQTQNYAPVALTVCELLSFLFFFRFGYMYFSTQFFGGITAELVFGMYYGYLWSILLYLVALVLGQVALYTAKVRKAANDEEAMAA